MKIIIYLYYFFRSVFLRGLYGTLRLLKAEYKYENMFGIKSARIKKSDSGEFFHYQGANYLTLFQVFSWLVERTRGFNFVDIGSGKGRAVFVAEYFGYNQLTGIELDDALVKEAHENLTRYVFKRKESQIRIIHQNAVKHDYENVPTVYFLFNPFNANILKQVIDKVCSQNSSEIWFIYLNPLYPQPFKEKNITCVKEIKTFLYTEALIFKREGLKQDYISS